jgi:hypothetical protein
MHERLNQKRRQVAALHTKCVALILLLLPLIYFYPAVLGRVFLAQGDGWLQNVGVRVQLGRAIAAGHLPLWDPYIFAGMPLLATVYPGTLYPPNWLFAILPVGAANNASAISLYFVGLVGSYLYTRRIGATRLGSLVSGMTFAFGGFLVIHMGQVSRMAAAAWLPWVLLAVENLCRRPSWRWIALGAAFIALQFFAGEPQMSFYTALVATAYLACRLVVNVRVSPSGTRIAALAVMASAGLLIASVQLLPAVELQQQGGRLSISYEYFSQYSMPARQLVGLIFPYFFGGASLPPYRLPYWGKWDVAVTSGYPGMAAMLLALVALLVTGRRRVAVFWSAIAAVALVLAMGNYLPFGLNHQLYRLPVYNLFRGSARHLLEFDFAVAVLAGLGMTCLQRCESQAAWRAVRRSLMIMGALVGFVAVLYRFLGPRILQPTPHRSLLDAEALVPITAFVLSAAAVLVFARHPARAPGAVLLLVILGDLMAFGHASEWRAISYAGALERLGDVPAVKLIKAQEDDPHKFRIVSHAAWPYGTNYDLIDFPNISIARGLESVNGYDVLRLPSIAAIAGDMNPEGIIKNVNVFAGEHQGLNILNVKYLIRERPGEIDPQRALTVDRLRFDSIPLDLSLGPGGRLDTVVGQVSANELAIISNMANSGAIADDEVIARIALVTNDSRRIERELRAGRDTSEWAYDRPDVKATIRHRRARVAESLPAEGFEAHRYISLIEFDRSVIERLEIIYARPDATLSIVRASLLDSATSSARSLDFLPLPEDRWRKLADRGPVSVYQNLKALPRAWFTGSILALPQTAVMSAITSGKLPSGEPFEPSETALLEGDGRSMSPVAGRSADARVSIMRHEPQHITLETHNAEPGFLVLSEIYYGGWRARIDGAKADIYRTDQTLRGIRVPPGDHRIELSYLPASFRNGLLCASAGLLLLCAGAFLSRRRVVRTA